MARKEILAFVALAMVRFDMTLVESGGEDNQQGRKINFPTLEERKPCLGMMSPAQGENVYIKVMPTER
jgi:hypothetical protein